MITTINLATLVSAADESELKNKASDEYALLVAEAKEGKRLRKGIEKLIDKAHRDRANVKPYYLEELITTE